MELQAEHDGLPRRLQNPSHGMRTHLRAQSGRGPSGGPRKHKRDGTGLSAEAHCGPHKHSGRRAPMARRQARRQASWACLNSKLGGSSPNSSRAPPLLPTHRLSAARWTEVARTRPPSRHSSACHPGRQHWGVCYPSRSPPVAFLPPKRRLCSTCRPAAPPPAAPPAHPARLQPTHVCPSTSDSAARRQAGRQGQGQAGRQAGPPARQPMQDCERGAAAACAAGGCWALRGRTCKMPAGALSVTDQAGILSL